MRIAIAAALDRYGFGSVAKLNVVEAASSACCQALRTVSTAH